MCRLASRSSDWIDVDPFETQQESWTRVIVTLEHLKQIYPDYRIFIACGADFVERWKEPCWAEEDCLRILKDFGLCIAPRSESFGNFINEVPYLNSNLDNVFFLEHNSLFDLSSTKVRSMIEKNQDIVGLVPTTVEVYLRNKRLYK